MLSSVFTNLVAEQSRQAEQQVPEHRRHDAVAEIFSETFDRGAGDAVSIEPHRVAADDVPYRFAPSRQPAPIECFRYIGDMIVKAALGDQYGDQQGFDRRADNSAVTQLLDRQPERRRSTDERDYGDDAADAS